MKLIGLAVIAFGIFYLINQSKEMEAARADQAAGPKPEREYERTEGAGAGRRGRLTLARSNQNQECRHDTY